MSGRIDGTITFSYGGTGAASPAAETTGLHDIVVCRRLRGVGFPVIGSSTIGSEDAGAGGEALLTTGDTLTVTLSRQAGADSSGGGGSLVIDPIMSEWAVASGGDAVAPLDGARPLFALRSPIDNSLREVSRRAHRLARGLTGPPWMKLAGILTGCALLVLASAVQAQTLVLGPAGVARSEGLGRAFETFSILGGTPGVAAAQFHSDFDLNNFQLPIAHTFKPIEGGYLDGIAPYAELTLDYLTADRTFLLTPSADSPRSVKLSFDAWSTLAGGGFDMPLGNGFRLRPILLAGYSHVGGDAIFFGPNAALFHSLVGGILSDASLSSALLGGALELVYETRFRGDITLRAQIRYNELAAVVTSASSTALKQNSSFGVATTSTVLSGPTGWHIAANAIRWLGYAKGTWLPDTDRRTLGFNAFAEIGAGLQVIAPNVVRGVQGGTVRASAIVGPGVTGWLLSAALDF